MSLTPELFSTLNHLTVSKYLAGGFLAALLWDHLTTLDREVNLIWNSRGKLRWMLRFSFIITRYGIEAFLLFIAYATSGIRENTQNLCKSVLISLSVFGAVVPQLSQFVFLLRIYMLTDMRRQILYCLTIIFVFGATVSQVFAILTALKIRKTFVYPVHSLCLAPTIDTRSSVGVMGPVCAFDITIIIYSIYDGLSRPRKRDSEVLIGLYKGCAKYFLVIAAIYAVELMTLILGSVQTFLIINYPSWALLSMMVSRLHFEIEETINEKYSLTFIR